MLLLTPAALAVGGAQPLPKGKDILISCKNPAPVNLLPAFISQLIQVISRIAPTPYIMASKNVRYEKVK
jgi:hypothetical protein